MFPGEYTLYGSARSYFTSKVENILRFQGLPYRLVNKMPHDGSAIETRTGSGAIPALVTPEDWPLADSTPISKFLDQRYANRPIIPKTPVQRIGTLLLEDWFDEWFMRVAMYTRWNFPESVEALVGSGASMQVLGKAWHEVTAHERREIDPLVQASLARIENFRFRMTGEVAAAYGTTPDQGEDVMVWFGEFLDHMAIHLEHYPFLLGERPSIADFVLSGGTAAHFGNDTWPRQFIEQRRPVFLDYAERCWNTKASDATWLPDDQIPDTWAPFFDEIQNRYLPYLLANREALGRGAAMVEIDLGYGTVATPPRIYQELSRMDIGDEIQKLDAAERAAVEAAIPAGMIAPYLEPALDPIPDLVGHRDTFPDPYGIGVIEE